MFLWDHVCLANNYFPMGVVRQVQSVKYPLVCGTRKGRHAQLGVIELAFNDLTLSTLILVN